MVIVDTSVWIEYFKNNSYRDVLFSLIDSGTLAINELILTELVPSIRLKHEEALEVLLQSVPMLRIHVDWNELANIQTALLQNGINKVGLPDLIILQNALQNNATVCSIDKHMRLAAPFVGCQMLEIRK